MFRTIFAALLALTAAAAPALAAVQGEPVEYKAGGVAMQGYLAYDDAVKGKRPGVIVIHEWWGHNEYARKRARMLAELGYTALAVDMYGGGQTADHPDNAKQFMQALTGDPKLVRARFDAALKALRKHKTVDARHVAAIGYCMGGIIVLNMAREGANLAGVASFHGSLGTATPAQPGKVRAKVLVLTGAADPFVPAEQVEAFRKEMDAARADYKLVSYPGAKHSFTSPDADALGPKFNLPFAYDAAADQASWAELQAFFGRIFRK
jgi:dienelactone hydrolase